MEGELEIKFDMQTYREQEDAIKFLFETYPANTNREEVLVKVAVLDSFYSTQTRKHVPFYKVMEKIIDKKTNFDDDLKNGEKNLVSKISEIEYEGETKHLLSFASKYCSLSDLYGPKTDSFSLYDSIVCKMLKNYGFPVKGSNDKAELYKNYREKIEEFRNACGLKNFTCREIDQFLWLKGKIEDSKEDKENKKK